MSVFWTILLFLRSISRKNNRGQSINHFEFNVCFLYIFAQGDDVAYWIISLNFYESEVGKNISKTIERVGIIGQREYYSLDLNVGATALAIISSHRFVLLLETEPFLLNTSLVASDYITRVLGAFWYLQRPRAYFASWEILDWILSSSPFFTHVCRTSPTSTGDAGRSQHIWHERHDAGDSAGPPHGPSTKVCTWQCVATCWIGRKKLHI